MSLCAFLLSAWCSSSWGPLAEASICPDLAIAIIKVVSIAALARNNKLSPCLDKAVYQTHSSQVV
jgi:hypothetical protein